MSTVAKVVRRAEPTEIPALARALAGAFFDDPVSIWTCRPDSLRPAVLERFFAARMRQLAERGEIWTTEELAGAPVWAEPERWKTSGIDPGAGAGGMRPRRGGRLPRVLEGAKPRLLRPARRPGEGEWRLPRGPRVWGMWHDPRSSSAPHRV